MKLKRSKCWTCGGSGKIMGATGDPKHPMRVLPCPHCEDAPKPMEPRRVLKMLRDQNQVPKLLRDMDETVITLVQVLAETADTFEVMLEERDRYAKAIEDFEWKPASVPVPKALQSTPMKMKRLLLVIPHHEEPVMGWYMGGLTKAFYMEGSPSQWKPTHWMAVPTKPTRD